MKNVRSILLLTVSFLLFLASIALLWTWGYRLYVKGPNENAKAGVTTKDALAAPGTKHDSLQSVYTATVNKLDERLDSASTTQDSLKGQLDMKLGEFYRLRNEIVVLLKNHGSDASLELARQKIESLQQKVKDLLNRNMDVENENKKLAAVLQQLAGNTNTPATVAQRTNYNASMPVQKNDNGSVLTVSDLRLAAMTVENDKELETTQARQTQKLVGSFIVKDNGSQPGNNEVVIVVLQPDGQVLKNSAWESGTFITDEGKKIYSYKLRFDHKRGEARHLLFSLSSDRYSKCNYTMQVYYNGVLVGRLLKTLS